MKKVALILGSAPSPKVKVNYDDIYCANGSVASAYKYCSMGPVATIMGSTVYLFPKFLNALRGLNCGVIYVRSKRQIKSIFDLLKYIKNDYDSWLFLFQHRMNKNNFIYKRIVKLKKSKYHNIVIGLCGTEAIEILKKKDLSSGMLALILAINELKYSKFIMAGFRFTEEYEYQESNTRHSGHYHTDLALIKLLLARKYPIVTTESSFSKLTGVPLIEG